MNRVRIVALSAVALGTAVTLGTKFQQSREAAAMAEVARTEIVEPAVTVAAAPVAALSTASVAAPLLPQPDVRPAGLPAPLPASELPSLVASADLQPGVSERHLVAPSLPDLPDGTVRSNAPIAPASVVPGVQPPMAMEGVQSLGTDGAGGLIAPSIAGNTLAAPATPETQFVQASTSEPIDPQLQAELAACAVWLVVTPASDAMLETSVYAPCDGGARVHLSHAGMEFDTVLGADGQLLVQMPALAELASVNLTFMDGRTQSDQTSVPDMANVERVVLMWNAPAAFGLNAYEFGAGFGDSGHVFAGAPHQPGIFGEGYVTLLGDPSLPDAQVAQVYSYPSGESAQTGRVRLEIEAPVTLETCGTTIGARSLEVHGAESVQARDIRVDMPICDGAGGYVVLPGVLPSLQIAMN